MYCSAVNAPLLRSLPLFLLVACASKTAPEGYEAVEPDAEDLSAFDEDEPPEPTPVDDSGKAEASPEASPEPSPSESAEAPVGEAAAAIGEAAATLDVKKK